MKTWHTVIIQIKKYLYTRQQSGMGHMLLVTHECLSLLSVCVCVFVCLSMNFSPMWPALISL